MQRRSTSVDSSVFVCRLILSRVHMCTHKWDFVRRISLNLINVVMHWCCAQYSCIQVWYAKRFSPCVFISSWIFFLYVAGESHEGVIKLREVGSKQVQGTLTLVYTWSYMLMYKCTHTHTYAHTQDAQSFTMRAHTCTLAQESMHNSCEPFIV